MKTKFILSGLAGGISYFLIGWLVYGIVLSGFYESNTLHYDGLSKDMPVLWLLALSNLMAAYFLAFVFDSWAKISTFIGGFAGGLIMGLFMAIIYNFSSYSMLNLMSTKLVLVDIIVSGLVIGIVGGVVGLVLGSGKKAE